MQHVVFLTLLVLLVLSQTSDAFSLSPIAPTRTTATTTSTASSASSSSTRLFASTATPKNSKKGGYEPKWKKKATLAEQSGGTPANFQDVGLKGSVRVIFRQGNETKTTMAMTGQFLRDVASQAGQYIKYGCGKGECGTCEALVNGKWIRPCSTTVPATLAPGDEYVIQVKEAKSKAVSSGKFYSFRSFIRGFWNNLLGMVGFVKSRRNASRNWQERQDYEDLIKQKTMEKKMQRLAAQAAQPQQQQGPSGGTGLSA